MTTIYFCCEYHEDEHYWLITGVGPATGTGETLEAAIIDWKESFLRACMEVAKQTEPDV